MSVVCIVYATVLALRTLAIGFQDFYDKKDCLSMSLVTVVMPVYNGGDTVATAIDSALAQTGCHVEVIVVNDGSTDNTDVVLDRYRDRIRVIRKENAGAKGIGINRNLAARAGSGEWIAFLDHDDLWEVGKLEAQISLAEKFNADVVYTNVAIIGDTSRVGRVAYRNSRASVEELFSALLFDNFLFTSSVIVRRTAFEEIGGFEEDGTVVEDWDLWLRLSAANYKFVGCDELLTYYAWSGSSASKKHSEARGLRCAAIHRALSTPRGNRLSWATKRRVRANVECTSAWFLSADDPLVAAGWYARALFYWPFDLRYYKGVVKGLLGRS
jgi:glycosyltransferase involved in cell wall biosynthesis